MQEQNTKTDSKMTEQEALEILRRDWPEYNKATERTIKDGGSLVDWLETLESFAEVISL